uniref:Alanine--tRNA ligase n=1 Tax=Phlebotomus papatasi TaxID=29031 RepID=A0A1B0D4A3_PHLPP
MCVAFRRHYSSGLTRKSSSAKYVRQQFLDFFLSNNHRFVRSSPVVPFCDPTLAFVNAGMNQFKGVLLGRETPRHRRVVNSQKCIRVGGKHNDLNVVGTDGYHHTFFEMLGNWSFGDYFKEEACRMAWSLITGPLRITPQRLYVTYFGGNERLGLPADTECRDIWRSIGLPVDKILPFGMEENFWEMGQTGPCGPCTEIHIDHTLKLDNRALSVNLGLADLTELWNIVFIQYNREEDGTVSSLPERHVDTGMGFERLLAIQQGSRSNYDTDLFLPLFDSIEKAAKCEPYRGAFSATAATYQLDTAYRIIADHSRMILASLADGMIPDQNHKLRRILRRALLISERSFCQKRLLHEVIPRVAEILGDTYPEMQTRLTDVLTIVSHEEEVFDILRQSSSQEVKKLIKEYPHLEELDVLDSPGFVLAFEELQRHKQHFNVASSGLPIIPSDLLFKFYDTYGLDRDTLEHLACLEKLHMDLGAFEEHLRMSKRKTLTSRRSSMKISQQDIARIPETDNSPKYEYTYDQEIRNYKIPPVQAKVLAIVQDREVVGSAEKLSEGESVAIIVDKSNFYYESGGQQGDFGTIVLPCGQELTVRNVENLQNRLLHTVVWKDGAKIATGDQVTLNVNSEARSGNILHHTATHLLNAAVRKITQGVVYQRSSSVTNSGLKMEFGVYGDKKLDAENIERLEGVVRSAIENEIPLQVATIDSQELLRQNQDITMVPGEVYPDRGLRLVEIIGRDIKSRELCCGTHARNTRELEDFCITGVRSLGRASYVVIGVAGKAAVRAQEMGKQMAEDVQVIKRDLETGKQQIEHLEARVHRLKNVLQHGFQENLTIPHAVKVSSLETLNGIAKKIRSVTRESLREFIEIEMKNVLDDNPPNLSPFIVHFLSSASLMESVSLQKATRLCPDRPILGSVTKEFTAELWLQKVAQVFKSQCAAPKGQDGQLVCNMKGKKIKFSAVDSQLETALTFARDYASKFMPR